MALASSGASAGNVPYVYDNLGRLVVVYDASGNASVYNYDAVGNLLSIANYASNQFAAFDLSQSGSTLTIYGIDFCSNATVTINGASAAISSERSTQIVVSTSGATSGPVVVTCGSNQTAAGNFSANALPGAPTITGFTPTTGSAGTSVTISGTNFNPVPTDNAVEFNVALAQVTSASATTIVAAVPSGATSGPISVETPYGQTTTTRDFYIAPPGATLDYTGQATLGTQITATSSTANQDMLVVFSGTAGHYASFSFTNSTFSTCPQVTVYNPDGTALAPATWYCGSSFFIDAQLLKKTGAYSVLINPGSSTGSVNLTIYDATPQSGTISVGGSPVTVTTTIPGQDASLTFSGTSGQQVSVNISNSTLDCPTVKVLNPDNSVLTSLFFCGSGGFIDVQTLPSTGTYTLFIDSADKAGSITTKLNDATAQHGTIVIGGPAVTSAVGSPGQDVYLSFSGNANQQVSVNLTNSTLDCPTVKILNPDNSVFTSLLFCGSVGFIDVQTLPSTGTYTLFIDSADKAGSITAKLNDASVQHGTIVIGGAAVTSNVASPGQDVYLTFGGTSGQQVSVNLTNSTLDCPTVKILNPDNSALTSLLFCGSVGFIDVQTLPSTGTYTLFIDSADKAGSITTQLYDASAQHGAITIGGAAVTSTVSSPGQDVYLSFTGNANQQVSVSLTNSTLDCPTIKILNPDNSTLDSYLFCGATGFIDVQTLPTTGTYSVYIDSNDKAGSITAQLNDATAVTGTITPNGNAVSETVNPGQDINLTFAGGAGQTVTLSFSNSTLDCPTMKILKPDGTSLASSFSCGSSNSLGSQTLPTTGNYAAFIDTNDKAGSITLTLTSP